MTPYSMAAGRGEASLERAASSSRQARGKQMMYEYQPITGVRNADPPLVDVPHIGYNPLIAVVNQ